MKKLAILAVLAATIGTSVQAGAIERACMRSDRAVGNKSLCGCIQDAANVTLTRRDQKLAAEFFRDPQRAQDIRQSKNGSHSVFWERYKAFGATAAAYCS